MKNRELLIIFFIILIAYILAGFWEVEWIEGVYYKTRPFSWIRYWAFLWYGTILVLMSGYPILTWILTKDKKKTISVILVTGMGWFFSFIQEFVYMFYSGRGLYMFYQFGDMYKYPQYSYLIGPFPWFYFLYTALGLLFLYIFVKYNKD